MRALQRNMVHVLHGELRALLLLMRWWWFSFYFLIVVVVVALVFLRTTTPRCFRVSYGKKAAPQQFLSRRPPPSHDLP